MSQFPGQTEPKISVITVCRNAADFMEQAVRSVVSQTYANLEYVIIDGGSTDGTVEIIRKYEPRLAYWHSRPDRGLAHAFNLGYAQTTGDWIIYLHADDFFLEPTVLENMAPHLHTHDRADVVMGQVIKMTRRQDPEPLPLYCPHANPWVWSRFRRLCTMPHQAAFTHRRYFQRVGPFDESFKIALDYDFFLRAGPELKCPYVPVAVTGMRTGGIGARNILRTLREAQRAQLQNRSLPLWFSWLNLYAIFGHWLLSWTAHQALDPFADRLLGPDRHLVTESQSIARLVAGRAWRGLRGFKSGAER